MKPRLSILLVAALALPATADQPTDQLTDPLLEEPREEAAAIDGNATNWTPRLYGEYAFLFHNTEYDDPPAPRADERSYLRQTLELGALWEFNERLELRAGLELEHDIADALDSFEPTWDSFKLHPRLRLNWDWGWSALTAGHLEPTPHPLIIHLAPYDQPPAGLAFTGELNWLDWELWTARISRVSEDTKETFLAAGRVTPHLDFSGGGVIYELRLPLHFAYSHAGGYDTADYQVHSPPDGVRKEEVWNLGAVPCFSMGGMNGGITDVEIEVGVFANPADYRESLSVSFNTSVQGSWWSVGIGFWRIADSYQAVRSRPDLMPQNPCVAGVNSEPERYRAISFSAGLHYDLEPLKLWAEVRLTGMDYFDELTEEYLPLWGSSIIALGAEVSF